MEGLTDVAGGAGKIQKRKTEEALLQKQEEKQEAKEAELKRQRMAEEAAKAQARAQAGAQLET